MPNKEFPRGSRDVQALHGIPEGDWNDSSDWLVCDSGMAPRLRRKNGKTWIGAEMQIQALERWGCITPSEAREMRGLPAIPGGDYINVVDDIIDEPDVIRGDDCGPLLSAEQWQLVYPFAYGLTFLLLLWGCMALNN